MIKLIDLPDLGKKALDKLKQAGVKDLNSLLEKGKDLEGQENIASTCGLSATHVREWVRIADLLRVQGLELTLARALVEAEFSTVKLLSQAKPEAVEQALQSEGGDGNQPPSMDVIRGLIEKARALPVTVRLPEDFLFDEAGLANSVVACLLLNKDRMWRTLAKFGRKLLSAGLWELGNLPDERPPVEDPPPNLPPEFTNPTLERIQQVLDAMVASTVYHLPLDFATRVTPEKVKRLLASPAPPREPFTKEKIETFPKIAIGSDFLSGSLLKLYEKRLESGGKETAGGALISELWELETVITQEAFILKRALAVGELETLAQWLGALGSQHQPRLNRIASLQARLGALASPLNDFDSAARYAKLESLRRLFITNRIFAGQVLAMLRAKMPVDYLCMQARELPFRQDYLADAGVYDLLAGKVAARQVRVVGVMLPPQADRPDDLLLIRDYERANKHLRIRLPAPFYFKRFVGQLGVAAVTVSTEGALAGEVDAVPFPLSSPASDWQSFIAGQVRRFFLLWPGDSDAVLFPVMSESAALYLGYRELGNGGAR